MRNVKISVVTVCYNSARIIEDTIKSIVSQDSDDFEYIIIDGDSSDETKHIICKYRDKITSFVSERDKGIYDAMNKGALISKGDYVLYVNAGDILATPSVLSDVIKEMHADKDIYYGSIINKMSYGLVEVKPGSLERIIRRMVFSHQAVFTRRGLLVKHKFNLSYKFAADYDFLSRMYFKHCSFQNIDIPICITPIEEGATYANKWKSVKEHKRILKQNGVYTFTDFLAYVVDSYKSIVMRIILPAFLRKKVLIIKHKL